MQTLTEKLLARASSRGRVKPGEIVVVEPDVVLSHDNTAAISAIFQQLPHERLRYPERLAITLDHAVPPPTARHARNHARIREFVREQGIGNFFEAGRGICHQVLCEEGIVGPGMTLLGADSHSTHYGWLGAFSAGIGRSEVAALWATGQLWLRVPESIRITLAGKLSTGVTVKDLTIGMIGRLSSDGANYMAVEFEGDGIANLSPDSRAVLTNMMAEMGAKNACMAPDAATWRWLAETLSRTRPHDHKERLDVFRALALYPDSAADYAASHHIELDEIEPMVSCPDAVENALPLSAVARTPVDLGFIGTCTNGRLEDIAAAADIARGRRLRKRLLVIPASSLVLRDAAEAGYIADLIDAGATIGTPGCGPCMGVHLGVLAPGEVCISSANRNFRGRMGEPEAEIYLSNPAVVAASCVAGYLVHPADVTGGRPAAS
ncbi:MAG: aconitase/3-isopropylmalate dehydratase large subunit family protein [Chloroflexota bacterium]|nr:aconitase/3-isopropylmalate dehydratase large subunit family protein [Chloroflexota bacterium]MDE2948273.1 aconitase/3-isopropylmalate dehydratase large subunit family protein [Chloroflexota bacterium]